MSKYVKCSGLYVVPFLAVAAAFVGVRFYAQAEAASGPENALSTGSAVALTGLSIGPVAGLTTSWHVAPAETSIPLGTTLRFAVAAPSEADVSWSGAKEVRRDGAGSVAVCPLNEVGVQEVQVVVEIPGADPLVYGSVFDVVDFPVDEIEVGPIHGVSVEPVDLDENSTNEETMHYFFTFRSIAVLREVGEGRYRTSINRSVIASVEVNPPGFAPLIEWRADGETSVIGGTVTHAFRDAGMHTIAAGRPRNPNNPAPIEVETYAVTIVSDIENVPEGEPVMFEAVTDPPGYEDEISWLSSTKYGTAVPVLGEGPTFTVQFDDTWGDDPEFGLFRWLGVRADNAGFNRDEKTCNCCLPPPENLMCPPEGPETVVLCKLLLKTDCEAMGGSCIDGDCPDEANGTILVKHTNPAGSCRHCNIPSIECSEGQGGPCVDGPAKVDAWITAGTVSSCQDFANCAIPADFFFPGSDEFRDEVCYRGGGPLGPVDLPGFPEPPDFRDADTVVLRSDDPFDRCEIPPSFPSDPVAVDIEIVALSLKSAEPIIVTGGQNDEMWDVRVEIDPVKGPPQSVGRMMVTKEHCNGGTFDSDFNVCPRIIFTRVSDGEVRVIENGCEPCGQEFFQLLATTPWVHDLTAGLLTKNPVCTDMNVGVKELVPTTDCDCNNNGRRDICDVPQSDGCPEGTCEEGDDPPCSRDDDQDCIPDDPECQP